MCIPTQPGHPRCTVSCVPHPWKQEDTVLQVGLVESCWCQWSLRALVDDVIVGACRNPRQFLLRLLCDGLLDRTRRTSPNARLICICPVNVNVLSRWHFVTRSPREPICKPKYFPEKVMSEGHYDGARNMVALLAGKRRWILSKPENCGRMHMFRKGHPSGGCLRRVML